MLDADVAAALEVLAERYRSAPPGTDLAAARFKHETEVEFFTPACRRAEIARVDSGAIEGPAMPIPVRIYRPGGRGAAATVLWFHGGGWITGSLHTGDVIARELAAATGAVVVSIDYRLAPEHPFPAGMDDAVAGLTWARATVAELGGDLDRLAVAGDSAGGNLAAATALRARDEGIRSRATCPSTRSSTPT